MLMVLPMLVLLTKRPLQPEVRLFATVAFAGLASYFLQGTGFTYQAIPFRAFTILACCFLILQGSHINAAVIAAAITAGGIVAINAKKGFYRSEVAQEIAQIAQDLGDVDSLMVLSSHVDAGPLAATASGTKWVSRYPANWLVPGSLNRLEKTDCTRAPETCARLNAIAAINRTNNIADIAATHPELLVFDLSPGFFHNLGFSWEAFMAVDPSWQVVLGDYREVGRTARVAYYHYEPKPQMR